jgi:hypothetical protein
MRQRVEDDLLTLSEILAEAKLGQHTNAIANKVGLTPGQVQYRILKYDLKGARRDFRNGESPEYYLVVKTLGAQLAEHERVAVVREMKRRMKEARSKKV